MKTNSQLRQESLADLKGKWGPAIVSFLIIWGLCCIITMPESIYRVIEGRESSFLNLLTTLGTILVIVPLELGAFNAYLKFRRENDQNIPGNMFKIGFQNYGHNVGGYLLMGLFIFLWSLLLIIPGIIKSFAYFCVPYLLVEEPELTANEAINKSKDMMKGHKGQLFWMQLGFFGFIILGILTLCIGYIWLLPYMFNTYAGFYAEVKAEYQNRIQA